MKKNASDLFQFEALELLPLNVLMAEQMSAPETDSRIGVSDTYRSTQYVCETFYKPISRCVQDSELKSRRNP
jgi:hypothetical protein